MTTPERRDGAFGRWSTAASFMTPPVPSPDPQTPADERGAANDLRERVEALPINTLINLGWRTPSDRVQGSLYLRTRDGLRYCGPARDNWESTTLSQKTESSGTDDFEIVAAPPAPAAPGGERRTELDELAAAVREADDELERVMAARGHAGAAYDRTVSARVALADAYLAAPPSGRDQT